MANNALVIDDDKTTLDLLTFQLESEGFKVTTAENGLKGVELIKNNDFDVILTDLQLPDINGLEMVRRTKELSPHNEIIVVTGNDSTENAVEAIQLGARDYIVKPVDFDKLFVAIRNAVESKVQGEVNARQAAEIQELRGRLTSRTSYEGVIGGARSMKPCGGGGKATAFFCWTIATSDGCALLCAYSSSTVLAVGPERRSSQESGRLSFGP